MRMPSGPPPGSATVVATSTGGAAGAALVAGAAGAAVAGALVDGGAEPHAPNTAIASELIVPRRMRCCMRGRSHEVALRHMASLAISRTFIGASSTGQSVDPHRGARLAAQRLGHRVA